MGLNEYQNPNEPMEISLEELKDALVDDAIAKNQENGNLPDEDGFLVDLNSRIVEEDSQKSSEDLRAQVLEQESADIPYPEVQKKTIDRAIKVFKEDSKKKVYTLLLDKIKKELFELEPADISNQEFVSKKIQEVYKNFLEELTKKVKNNRAKIKANYIQINPENLFENTPDLKRVLDALHNLRDIVSSEGRGGSEYKKEFERILRNESFMKGLDNISSEFTKLLGKNSPVDRKFKDKIIKDIRLLALWAKGSFQTEFPGQDIESLRTSLISIANYFKRKREALLSEENLPVENAKRRKKKAEQDELVIETRSPKEILKEAENIFSEDIEASSNPSKLGRLCNAASHVLNLALSYQNVLNGKVSVYKKEGMDNVEISALLREALEQDEIYKELKKSIRDLDRMYSRLNANKKGYKIRYFEDAIKDSKKVLDSLMLIISTGTEKKVEIDRRLLQPIKE